MNNFVSTKNLPFADSGLFQIKVTQEPFANIGQICELLNRGFSISGIFQEPYVVALKIDIRTNVCYTAIV